MELQFTDEKLRQAQKEKENQISEVRKQENFRKNYNGPKFELGQLVSSKLPYHENSTGVIFKIIDDFNYWVAFPELKHHYYNSSICEMNAIHAMDLTLLKN